MTEPAPVHPGSVPGRYRRFIYGFLAAIFAVVLAAGLVLKMLGDVDIPWIWVAATPVFITSLVSAFLWVRLSD